MTTEELQAAIDRAWEAGQFRDLPIHTERNALRLEVNAFLFGDDITARSRWCIRIDAARVPPIRIEPWSDVLARLALV